MRMSADAFTTKPGALQDRLNIEVIRKVPKNEKTDQTDKALGENLAMNLTQGVLLCSRQSVR